MFDFKILQKDKNSKARLGILKTPNGVIHMPAFVPVATKGALRGLSFETAKKYGAEIFMMNTFHLFYQERYKIIGKAGGLHKFLNIKAPIMTDSGGFQVFSLGFGAEHGVGKVASMFPNKDKDEQVFLENRPSRNSSDSSGSLVSAVLPRRYVGDQAKTASDKFSQKTCSSLYTSRNFVKIDDDGATFKSPYDGKILRLTPEDSIKIQKQLGADIIFAFDECTSPLSDYNYTKKALEKTHNWAIRSLKAFRVSPRDVGVNPRQILFGIVQGGEYENLRIESAKFIGSLPFFGFGIGGSLGKSKQDINKVLNWTIPLLPENKPRHLLGIGEIDDLFNAVERGIDLFDCVIPTRWARHNTAFSFNGRLNLAASKFLTSKEPIDKKCGCGVCKNYSRAYICHLLREKEIYGIMLLTEHNLAWILNLMKKIREAIKNNEFQKLKKQLLRYY